MAALGQQAQFQVEDNQPYSFAESDWFTLDRHGLSIGMPNAYIEVRNDLLRNPASCKVMAEALVPAIQFAFTQVG